MQKFLSIIVVLSALHFSTFAQVKPFSRFEKAVDAERGGFAGNKENLSRLFNDERVRLGNRFEAELWNYLGKDADKHYWIGFFLTSLPYLHGSEPLPELAIRVHTRATELLQKRNDESSLGRRVTLYRMLAVSAKIAGNQEEAAGYRDKAEMILAKNKDLGAYLGARSEFHICVYENFDGSIDKCDPNPPPKEKMISAGWMNSRALNIVKPEYPSGLAGPRRTARVDVKIVTDVDGNVISTEIIRGPVELHNAAIEAARKLKFPPTFLSGFPAKVSGWISFEFKP